MKDYPDGIRPARYDFDRIDHLFNSIAPPQLYSANTALFEQGSAAVEVYFIKTGLIKLHRVVREGKEFIVDLRFPGALLGASSVIAQRPYQFTAITLVRSRLYRIPAAVFLELLRTDNNFSWAIQRMQSNEICDQSERIVQLACLSAQQRVEELLWQLISALEPEGLQKEIRFQLLLKHWEVSQLVAITPQHLSRVFKDMQQKGIIRQEKGWTIVPNPIRLFHQVKAS